MSGIDWAVQQQAGFNSLDEKQYAKEYYVDNTRVATGDGSKAAPFLQISEAVTAWEAFRLAQLNVYGRGVIWVMGTGTAYNHLAALPNYCDVIGVGALSRGNGAGIASVTGFVGTVSTYDAIAGSARGVKFENIQFIAGVGFWCADFVNLFRSEFSHCTFQSLTAACLGGIRFSGASGGVWIHDCQWAGSGLVIPIVGIQAQNQNFDHCLIEHNTINGTTAGILIDAGVIYADETVVRDNYIGDTGWGCATAIDDNSTAGKAVYMNNAVMGTALICCVNNGAARVHGNVSANGFVAVTAS